MKHLYRMLFVTGLFMVTACEHEPLDFHVDKPVSFAAQEEIDAYADLKTYINREANPNFKLGAGVSLAEYVQKGVMYRLLTKNFDEITPRSEMQHGAIVQANGTLNLSNVESLLTTAKDAGVTVYGQSLVTHANQNATYLNSLLTPLTVKNPTFTNELDLAGLKDDSFNGWSKANPGAGISVISEGTGNVKSVKLVSSSSSSAPEDLQLVSPDIPVETGSTYEVVFYIKSDAVGEGRVSFEGLTNNTPSLDWTESGSASPTFTTGTYWKKIKFRINSFEADRIKLHFDLGYRPNVTYNISVPTLYVYNPNSSTVDPNKAWIEAESGTVNSLWNVASHPDASGGRYVTIKDGNNSTGGPTSDTNGLLNYNFSVNVAGEYALWARVAVSVANGADDSFFFRMNGGSWVTFNGVASSTSFVWYRVTSANLNAGNNTITVSYREDGANLDKLYVTKDGDTPMGMGTTVPVATTVVLEKTAAEKGVIISEHLENWISGMVTSAGLTVKAWDVVREPMDDENTDELKTGVGRTLGTGEFYWQDYLGKDYAVKAFKLARQHGDESNLLFISDNNLHSNLDKCMGLINYVSYLESQGAKVDGIGTQMSLSIDSNKDSIREMFELLAATGKQIKISDLDVALGVATNQATEAHYTAQKEMYKYVVEKYMEIIPANKRYGITAWTPVGLQHGLWSEGSNLTRKPAYSGFADGLKK